MAAPTIPSCGNPKSPLIRIALPIIFKTFMMTETIITSFKRVWLRKIAAKFKYRPWMREKPPTIIKYRQVSWRIDASIFINWKIGRFKNRAIPVDIILTVPITSMDSTHNWLLLYSSSAPRHWVSTTVVAIQSIFIVIIMILMIWLPLTMAATEAWEWWLTIIWSILPTRSCKSSSIKMGMDILNKFELRVILSIAVNLLQ